MQCFNNVIGLKELCTDNTKTSSYLNRVGVSKSDVEDIITKDFESLESFVEDKVQLAASIIADTIRNKYSQHYINASIIEGNRLGFLQENQTVTSGDSDWRGIQINVRNSQSYLTLGISEISLTLDHTGSVAVNVYDLFQNKILHTETISAVAGQRVTAYPHITFESERRPLNLFIGYDTTGKDALKTLIRQGMCCGNNYCNHQFVRSSGSKITGSTFTEENRTAISNTAGVSVVYSVACNQKSWLCSHFAALETPLLYKTASEIMLHGIHSAPTSRANSTITIQKDALIERQAFYEGKFDESMRDITNSLVIPNDSRCFACNINHRHVISLP